MENDKYKWMKPFQRELYDGLCKAFEFKNLTELGNFLGLNNPYHGAKLIFEAQKQNLYLRKILELQHTSNKKISSLEDTVNKINSFKSSIENSLENLSNSLESIREIKKNLKD